MSLTRESIIEFLDTELGVESEEVSDDTELLSSGLVDSLAVMDLVTFVSQEAGVKVRSSDITLDNFNTIPGILHFTLDKEH
jgi:acyl carrier protein